MIISYVPRVAGTAKYAQMLYGVIIVCDIIYPDAFLRETVHVPTPTAITSTKDVSG